MPRHRAQRGHSTRRRLYLVLTTCLAIVAVVLVSGYLLGMGPDAPNVAATPEAAVTSCTGAAPASCGHSSSSPSPGSKAPAAARLRPSSTPSKPLSQTPPAAGRATVAASSSSSPAVTVLALINRARAQAGLPGYTVIAGLQASASKHNQLMADGCGLMHQCPGEPPLGDRETAAGVHWTSAGENIGEGGPVADTSTAITQMAVTLTQDMLNEKPPNDGHRLNLLSSTFTHIGIAIYCAPDGTVWMTQDFAN